VNRIGVLEELAIGGIVTLARPEVQLTFRIKESDENGARCPKKLQLVALRTRTVTTTGEPAAAVVRGEATSETMSGRATALWLAIASVLPPMPAAVSIRTTTSCHFRIRRSMGAKLDSAIPLLLDGRHDDPGMTGHGRIDPGTG
jgi:hypothetical protein